MFKRFISGKDIGILRKDLSLVDWKLSCVRFLWCEVVSKKCFEGGKYVLVMWMFLRVFFGERMFCGKYKIKIGFRLVWVKFRN